MSISEPNTDSGDGKRYLIITAHHDYRTPRRTSIHFIADELAKRGTVQFFSIRYSRLSLRKGDIRTVIDDRANQVEMHKGVECYLWKTPIHPFNMRRPGFSVVEDFLFWMYERSPNRTMVAWIKQADVVIYESGIAPIYFELAKRLNPSARHIYRGSDDLDTINVAGYAKRKFAKVSPHMDALCLLSKRMAANIASKKNVYCVPNGLDENLDAIGDPNPYGEGIHAVSIGSMLFDPSYFEAVGAAFPDVTFHVVGSGHPRTAGYAKNVVVYGDMKFADCIRYIKHAHFGIAPYVSDDVPDYLADSSMKMLQYDFFALPTVCPRSVTGQYSSRFGYVLGDAESMKAATRAALSARRERSRQILNWSEVTSRLLEPARFNDTAI